MLSENFHFVQTVVLKLRLNWFGLLSNLSCSNRTKSSQIANSFTLLFFFQKLEILADMFNLCILRYYQGRGCRIRLKFFCPVGQNPLQFELEALARLYFRF